MKKISKKFFRIALKVSVTFESFFAWVVLNEVSENEVSKIKWGFQKSSNI